jgi:hypothetical protein
MKIDFNGIGFFKKIFVDQILIAIDIKLLIHIVRLIQSHGQTGTASSAFIQENAYGLDFLSLEIFSNLFCGLRCNVKHDFLLKMDYRPKTALNLALSEQDLLSIPGSSIQN